MTDLDDLLAEVEIRTDSSHHWTGKFNLMISDPDLTKELAAAVRSLRDRPCPHIATSDDGTAFCMLAENQVGELRDDIRDLEDRLSAAPCRLDNNGCCRTHYSPSHHHCPVRPGGTDNPTSDCPNCGESDCQDSCAEERFLQALKLAGDQPGYAVMNGFTITDGETGAWLAGPCPTCGRDHPTGADDGC